MKGEVFSYANGNPNVTEQIPVDVRDSSSTHIVDGCDQYTKTLGIEWNSTEDYFKLTIASLPPLKSLTKCMLVSDVAKTFDTLGRFSPCIVLMKMLLQRLWEAAVKSMKRHLCHIASHNKLTFEEYSTVLSQIEACLNSHPLVPLPHEDDGVEALTPGHFLIGRPMEALPDPAFSYRKISLLRRWHLCQALIHQFWQRWSAEYVSTLRRSNKWYHQSNNIKVGDLVLIQEENLVPTKWPLARVVNTHPGKDAIV